MKRGDKVLSAIFLLLLSLTILVYTVRYCRTQNGLSVEVRSDGVLIKEIELNKNLTEEILIEYKNGKNIILIEEGRVAVISADCPDKDCIKRGWLKYKGDSSICLPNHLSIRLKGEAEVDAVTF